MPLATVAQSFSRWPTINGYTSGSTHPESIQSLVGSYSFQVNPKSWAVETKEALSTWKDRLARDGWVTGEPAGMGEVNATTTTNMLFDSYRGKSVLHTSFVIIPERGGVVSVVWHQIYWEDAGD